MPFITFIYKIGKYNKTYYGKYVYDYLSDDEVPLDIKMKNVLLSKYNEYRKKNNYADLDKKDLCVGILFHNNNTYVYSSLNEVKCFDFYYIKEKYDKSTYINGKLLE